MSALVLTTVGVGAAGSPRFAPAGLLVESLGVRVMIDGGPGSAPAGQLDAWLVTDMRSDATVRFSGCAWVDPTAQVSP